MSDVDGETAVGAMTRTGFGNETTMQTTTLLAAMHPGFFMPTEASTIAREIDPLMWFIHGITIFFTLAILIATAYFAWKYRESKYPVADPPGHNNVLEVTWTVIPSIIVFICFFWGFRVFMRMTTQQPAAVQIDALGQQWFWGFQYRNPLGGSDVKTSEMYMPVNVPVEITLRSNDVIHALYIPAMRVKKDVVPGRFNKIQVEATKIGDYSIYCAEYCGDKHSKMLTVVHVLSAEDFRAKLIDEANPIKPGVPPAEIGKKIAGLNGCVSCHSPDGAKGVGPTWKDMYGEPVDFADGGSVPSVDDNYIIESIRKPNAHVVKGFGVPSAMNAFSEGQLPDEHVKYLIAYMKSISAHAPADVAKEPATKPVSATDHGPNQ